MGVNRRWLKIYEFAKLGFNETDYFVFAINFRSFASVVFTEGSVNLQQRGLVAWDTHKLVGLID